MIRAKELLSKTILFITALIIVFPVLMTILYSFMGVSELKMSFQSLFSGGDVDKLLGFHIIPYKITLSGYYKVIFEQVEFVKIYISTMIIVFAITIGQTTLSIFAAYGLVHHSFKFKKQILIMLIFTALMPFQVTVVPSYIMLNRMELLDTWYALLFTGVFSSFGTLLIMPFMRRASRSSIEAAKIDGASELIILIKVVIPQIKSGIGLLMIFLFIDYWNMVEQPMVFIQDRAKHPMSVFLSYIAQTDVAMFFPGASLYIIPSILVFMGMIYLISNEIKTLTGSDNR